MQPLSNTSVMQHDREARSATALPQHCRPHCMCCACHFSIRARLDPERCRCSTQAKLCVGNIPLKKLRA